jgi:arginase family enzyme
MTTRYALRPNLTAADYRGNPYVFQDGSRHLRAIGWHRLRPGDGAVIAAIRRRRGPATARELGLIERSCGARGAASRLLAGGLLEPVEGHERCPGDLPEAEHRFVQPTFFNVPPDLPPEAADVAIYAMPIAHADETAGTELAPHALRRFTSANCSWSKVWPDGVYSEAVLDGAGLVLCRDLVARDAGTIETAGRSLREVEGAVRRAWASCRRSTRTRPLFVGGDHAATLLTLRALAAERGSLADVTVIHLDAHHDCFSQDAAWFHHAAPIYGLLATTDVGRVVSLGLRSIVDTRVVRELGRGPSSPIREALASRRLVHYGVAPSLALLERGELSRLVLPGSSVYLSIDLDCVSGGALGDVVATPEADGFTWFDLFRLVDRLREIGPLLGADLVEFSPVGRGTLDALKRVTTLLLLMMDVLRHRERARVGGLGGDHAVA